MSSVLTVGDLTLNVIKWEPNKPRPLKIVAMAPISRPWQSDKIIDAEAEILQYVDGSGQLHCSFDPSQIEAINAWHKQVWDGAVEGAPPSHYKREGRWLNNKCLGCFPVSVIGYQVNISVDMLKE